MDEIAIWLLPCLFILIFVLVGIGKLIDEINASKSKVPGARLKVSGLKTVESALDVAVKDAAGLIEKETRQATLYPRAVIKTGMKYGRYVERGTSAPSAVRTGRLRKSLFPGFYSTGTVDAAHGIGATGTFHGDLAGLADDDHPIWRQSSEYLDAWPCSWCERLNSVGQPVCSDCGGARLTRIQNIPRAWRCEWDGHQNVSKPFKCEKCGGKRLL